MGLMSANHTQMEQDFVSDFKRDHILFDDLFDNSTLQNLTQGHGNAERPLEGSTWWGVFQAQSPITNVGFSKIVWSHDDADVAHDNSHVADMWGPLTEDYVRSYLTFSSQARDRFAKYQDRIDYLKLEAGLEGSCVNAKSEEGFYLFLERNPELGLTSLVLTDEGNLRAVWKAPDQFRFAVEFNADETLQFVVFRKRSGFSYVSRVTGTDTMKGVEQLIDVFELRQMLEK